MPAAALPAECSVCMVTGLHRRLHTLSFSRSQHTAYRGLS